MLYKLCVEGLLHHWDQRRGIYSEFSLDEKLRVCREVALAMQADDRAEYETDKLREVFAAVLGDPARAEKLLEHIRYRTGLLLERRPGIFAFAHLTFQEYLAARAVHEGNCRGVDVERLVREHDDDRWREVIALYCGLAPVPAARDMIERLIAKPDSRSLSTILAEAYLSVGVELSQDREFRRRVLERIAIAPVSARFPGELMRFPEDEVAPIAHLAVGKIASNLRVSEAHGWLNGYSARLDVVSLVERLRAWRTMNSIQISELIHLLHSFAPDTVLAEMASDTDMYTAPGPTFETGSYGSQAEVALIGLSHSAIVERPNSPGFNAALLQVLRALVNSKSIRFDLG